MDNMIRLESFRKENDIAFFKIKDFVNSFCDEFSFVETDSFLSSKPFLSDIEITEGVLTGYATVDGAPIYLVAQNSTQLGGSLGKAGAEKICKCIDKALRAQAPLVSVIDSNGARVGEGTAVMEAYASIISAATAIAGTIPHICIVKGNAVGLQASFCALADFVIAMPEAVYSVATPMCLASKENDMKKPCEILGAKNLLKSGSVHFAPESVEKCGELVKYLVDFVNGKAEDSKDDLNRQAPVLEQNASVKNILEAVCDSGSYKILGDGDSCVVCAIGYVGEKAVGIVITKGELCEKSLKNATRFINYLDSFNIPLLTFVDSATVKSSISCEIGGLAETTANLFYAISSSDIAKISIITGKAIGFSYTAFASKNIGFDYVYAYPNATISPVASDLAVDVLFSNELKSAKDPVLAREQLAERYESISDVFVSAKEGYVDNVIEPSLTRAYVISVLQMLD